MASSLDPVKVSFFPTYSFRDCVNALSRNRVVHRIRDDDHAAGGQALTTTDIKERMPNGRLSLLPRELRYVIYDVLIAQQHQLFLTFPHPTRGVLECLSHTSHWMQNDISEWNAVSPYVIRDHLFGLVNPSKTTVSVRVVPQMPAASPFRWEYLYTFPAPFEASETSSERHSVYKHWQEAICLVQGMGGQSMGVDFGGKTGVSAGLYLEDKVESNWRTMSCFYVAFAGMVGIAPITLVRKPRALVHPRGNAAGLN